MRLTVFNMMAFFVCFNLSLYLLNTYHPLGSQHEISPYSEPSEMIWVTPSLDHEGIVIAASVVTAAAIIGYLAGNMIVGGSIGLLLLVITLIFPVARWVLFGFPLFLADIGVPSAISDVLVALISFVWFWFFISLFAERSGVSEGW